MIAYQGPFTRMQLISFKGVTFTPTLNIRPVNTKYMWLFLGNKTIFFKRTNFPILFFQSTDCSIMSIIGNDYENFYSCVIIFLFLCNNWHKATQDVSLKQLETRHSVTLDNMEVLGTCFSHTVCDKSCMELFIYCVIRK